MGIKGRVFETPLKNMKIGKGKATIKDVPLLSTGLWKEIVVAEENVDEVLEYQGDDGPCHVVLDHDESVQNWVGTGDKFLKEKHADGYIYVKGNLEVSDESTIAKLQAVKEKGGGLLGISPRIEWDQKDEDGNVTGLKIAHISIVVDPAQGLITRLSEGGMIVIQIGEDLASKDTRPNKCKCPKCGAVADKEFGKPCREVKCPKCGTPMEGVQMEEGNMEKCPKCGAKVKKTDKVCPECGAKLEAKQPEPFLMSAADFKGAKRCPECKTILSKDAKECSKCGAKFEDGGEPIPARCPECGGEIDADAGKCKGCGKTIKELGWVIPFPIDSVGEDEEITINKGTAQEIDQLLRNPNIGTPELKGFLERMREKLKKKKKEPTDDDPEDQQDKIKCPECGKEVIPKDGKCPECGAKIEKSKPDPDPDPDPEENQSKSYAFPTQDGIEEVKKGIYSKELIKTGTFKHPEEPGFIPIDRPFMQTLIENTEKVFSGRVPTYIGHPEVGKEPADKVVGWLSDITLDKVMKGNVNVTNDLVKGRVDEKTLRDASLGIAFSFIDEHGKESGPVITHLAITTTPYIRGLEEFKQLVASKTDMAVENVEEVKEDFFGSKRLKELEAQMSTMQTEHSDLKGKYEIQLKKQIQEVTDAAVTRVDGLVETGLLKRAAKDRLAEFVKAAVKFAFDDKRSMAEAVLDILETGLQKGEVDLLGDPALQSTSDVKEYLTKEDIDKYTGRLTQYERDEVIKLDAAGRPYWAKGRPS